MAYNINLSSHTANQMGIGAGGQGGMGVIGAIHGGGSGHYASITTTGQGITTAGSSGNITGTSFFDTISKVEERLEKIEERLLIINPDEKLLEKYPGLKQAYDHYLLMEKLCRE